MVLIESTLAFVQFSDCIDLTHDLDHISDHSSNLLLWYGRRWNKHVIKAGLARLAQWYFMVCRNHYKLFRCLRRQHGFWENIESILEKLFHFWCLGNIYTHVLLAEKQNGKLAEVPTLCPCLWNVWPNPAVSKLGYERSYWKEAQWHVSDNCALFSRSSLRTYHGLHLDSHRHPRRWLADQTTNACGWRWWFKWLVLNLQSWASLHLFALLGVHGFDHGWLRRLRWSWQRRIHL